MGAEVFVALFDGDAGEPLHSAERDSYVRAAGDEQLRRQRYWVWKLLERVLAERFDTDADRFTRDSRGRWTDVRGELWCSLSHSECAVAVAVARFPVGVDVQVMDAFCEAPSGLAKRICTDGEYEYWRTLSVDERKFYLAERWSTKEALFKLDGGSVFKPSAIDTSRRDTLCRGVKLDGECYTLVLAR